MSGRSAGVEEGGVPGAPEEGRAARAADFRSGSRRGLGVGLVFLLLCVCAAHLGALRGSLLADDFMLIRAMSTPSGAADLLGGLRQFGQPIPGVPAPLPADVDPKFWRPLWRFTFFVDLALWGNHAAGYFATNLGLHLSASLLLVVLLLRLGWPPLTACGAATLFAVHPSHHEAVWWPASRADLLALTLTLGAACVVAGPRWVGAAAGSGAVAGSVGVEGSAGPGSGRGGVPARSLLVAGLLLCALLSKESALTAPGLLLGVALLAPARRSRPILARLSILLLPALAFLLYLGARHAMLGTFLGGYAGVDGEWFDANFWPNQRATLNTLFRFARGGVAGAALGPWILGALALLGGAAVAREVTDLPRAAGTRGTPVAHELGPTAGPFGRWVLPAAALSIVLALLPTWQFGIHAALHENARFLYAATAAAGVLIAGAAHRAADWLPAALRRPMEAAFIALLCLVSVGLLHAATAPRRAAWQAADALFPALRALPAPDTDGALVFVDLPDHFGFAYIARNALPDALMPPFVAEAPRGTIIGLTDAPRDRARLRQLEHLGGSPSNRFAVWDTRSRSLHPMRLR